MIRGMVTRLDVNGEYCVGSPGGLFDSCLTLDRGGAGLGLEIRVGEPRHFVPVAEAVMRLVSRIEPLVSAYILYDVVVNGIVGTHGSMNRRLARLRKLRRTVAAIVGYRDGYLVEAVDAFAPVLELLDLVIDAMESFSNSVHRVRDRVHQYIYPLLRLSLEALLSPTVVYAMEARDGTRVWITATPYARHGEPGRQRYTIEPRYELVIENGRKHKTLNVARDGALRFTMEMQRRRCRRYPWLDKCKHTQIPGDKLVPLIDLFLGKGWR